MAYTDTLPILGNFIETIITTDVMASDSRLYLSDVSSFPDVTAGKDHIPCVIRAVDVDAREIVYVTDVDRASSSVYVTRGMEGTEAKDWSRASYLYCTMTAQSAERMRINGFAPILDAQGNRPAMTWASSNSFTLVGDYTMAIEPNVSARIIDNHGVVPPTDANQAIHVTRATYSDGKTTVSLRNVALPSTLLGIDIGILPSSAPMYHPDTIVADGVTLTQTGNVISAKQGGESDRGIVNKQDVINFVRAAMLDAAYPVGAVYISTVATSPADLFGGKWSSLEGRFLIGADSTYGAGSVGGEASHALTVDEVPSHSHSMSESGAHTHTRGTMDITGGGLRWEHKDWDMFNKQVAGAFYVNTNVTNAVGSSGTDRDNRQIDFKASRSWTGETSSNGKHTHAIQSVGGGKAHNNMPPYLSVYMWKRTA